MVNNNPKWDIIQGNWRQLKGNIQERWGKLTDDDIMQMRGERQQLAGMLQEKYGIARDEANRQIDEWSEQLKVS